MTKPGTSPVKPTGAPWHYRLEPFWVGGLMGLLLLLGTAAWLGGVAPVDERYELALYAMLGTLFPALLLALSLPEISRFFPNAARTVYLRVDDKLYPTVYGERRGDVANLFGVAAYGRSGFSAGIPVQELGPGRHELSLVVSENGESYQESAEKIFLRRKSSVQGWRLHVENTIGPSRSLGER